MRAVYICKGYFQHKHRFKFTANLCGFIQSSVNMNRIHFYSLWIFKHWKLKKILIAGSGRNKRALARRIQKGMKPI